MHVMHIANCVSSRQQSCSRQYVLLTVLLLLLLFLFSQPSSV